MNLLTEIDVIIWHNDEVGVRFWRGRIPEAFDAISEASAVRLYTALQGCTKARTRFDGDQMIVTVRI